MKVGQDNSIYSLFTPKAHNKSPSVADEKLDVSRAAPQKAPAVRSDQELAADFHARMAKQSLDWADADNDGKVTKQEFLDGQARLAEQDNRPNDAKANERKWSAIDAEGKGWVDEGGLRGGLEKIFPVSVGHLDPDYAERLRNPNR
ncbi:EF-hand domain-containing protein [Rhizobium sp. RAF36]|uniref:EF-hand domain-containing protein n=1 Tax=Rhizobium sp. RAF36 TaxID=3233055 RepID=UPI003F9CDFDA